MIFDEYDLTITLTEPMLGTVPKDPNIYAKYIAEQAIKARKKIPGMFEDGPVDVGGTVSDEEAEALLAEEIETVAASEEKGWTGFHEDKDGLFLYDYQVKGFLKEAGNILKDQLKMTALKSKIDNHVFVFPRRIHFATAPSGVLERPLRAMTVQGPRVTLVRSDQVDAGTVLNVKLRVLKAKDKDQITEELLRDILDYGLLKGLGQFRNGSYGRFEYVLQKTS